MNILFVCTGNTCRSPLAAEIGRVMAKERGLDYSFDSAGIYADEGCFPSVGSIEAAHTFGGDITGHRATMINADMIADADAVLCMTASHKQVLAAAFHQFADKIFTFKEYVGESGDIDDPFGQPVDVYRETAAEMARLTDLLLSR